MGDLGEGARFVVGIHHQHVVFHDECAVFFEHEECLAGVAHDHPNDAVIDGVAGGDGVDINPGFGEGVAHTGEHARSVFEKNG